MQKVMLIDAVHPEEMRMVITDHKSTIHEFDFTTSAKKQIKGNIYLAKVTRVEPSLQAAFVEYGGGKQGFLPFAEIHTDYYQIPVSDRKRLIEEEEQAFAEQELEAERDEQQPREIRGGRRRGRNRSRNSSENEASAEGTENTEVSDNTLEAEATDSTGEALALALEPIEPIAMDENDNDDESPATLAESSGIEATESISSEVVIDNDLDFVETEQTIETIGEETNGNNAEESAASAEGERAEKQEKSEDQGVETLSSEEEIERPRRNHYTRRYKIQEVIKRNQILLVQVIKEERGNKGVSLTTFMSLAGRYCVLMPNSPRGGGVSRKINTGDDRKRLKSIISDLKLPKGMSVIIRTAGSNRTKTEIKRDFDYLVKLWNQIRENTLASSAPALIYEESDLIKRSIRDAYSNEIDAVIVDGEPAFKDAKAFMRMLVPSHAPRVKLHKGNIPLFYDYNVEEQLLSMHEPVVKLRSGGYIVMNPTEALISIDVNSGRSTGERNIEETAYKTNVEAAQEIARQLRLRDLAGLIVIDFIDMMDGKNRRNVERILKEALRSDRAKIQIGRISPFGLLEMSRQRLRPSISEAMNRTCPHCNGTGNIRSDATVAIHIIRNLEKEVGQAVIEKFRIFLTPSVALYMLNNLRGELDKLEQTHQLDIEVQIDAALTDGDFRIEKIKNKEKTREREQQLKNQPSSRSFAVEEDEEIDPEDLDADAEATEDAEGNAEDKPNRRERGGRNRNRNRRRGRDRDREPNAEGQNAAASNSTEGEAAEGESVERDANTSTENEGGEERRPRRRNRNRNRRWERDRDGEGNAQPSANDSSSEAENTQVTFRVNDEPQDEAKPRHRGGRSHAKSAEETAVERPALQPAVSLAAPQFPEVNIKKAPEPELAVMVKKEPAKPARKGWWQKIVD